MTETHPGGYHPDTEELFDLNISYERSCLKSLQKLGPAVTSNFLEMTFKIMSDATTNGLHVEPIEGTADKSLRSVRMDRGNRAIGSLHGRSLIFLHVDSHDKAYRWARGRRVELDKATRRIRVVEAVVDSEVIQSAPAPEFRQEGLFDGFDDAILKGLGLGDGEIARARNVVNEADLEKIQDDIDSTSFDVLAALVMGYPPEEVAGLIAGDTPEVPDSIEEMVDTEAGRATIFIPEDEQELRRVLEGDPGDWAVFLHPEQRKLAYRDYNGHALVRGGAGTGKTVVAMHRARYIADQLAKRGPQNSERVLLTTFTVNLAKDIEANLRLLCPEHLEGPSPRIEVKNLDAWVGEYLRRRNFARKIVYFDADESVETLWSEALDQTDIPEGLSDAFLRSEWTQIIQAKGIESKGAYFKASRVGRGTPLDRKKRAAIWPVFEAFRALMHAKGLAEPDDAYREAIAMLEGDATTLPYTAVVVDEAQDMGEQALRLAAAIASGASESDAGNSLFIVGDAHQRIYDRKASLSSCGINVRGRARRLRLNYRTSHQIRQWAVALLKDVSVDDLDEGSDNLDGYRSVFTGPEPILLGFDTIAEEHEEIAKRASQAAQNGSVGVLARTNAYLDKIAGYFERTATPVVRLRNRTPDDLSKPGVRLATMHRSKGLEFDAVFMVGISQDQVPLPLALSSAVDAANERENLEREKSLVHVAATRAKKALIVSWVSAPSSLLGQSIPVTADGR